jgi:hypothetical protein
MAAPLNSFFKKYSLIILLLLLIPGPLSAINIHGLYVSSCERELGIIIKAEKTKITLLTLEGKFKIIPRHEIIYLTYYSIDSFPDVNVQINSMSDVIRIDTVQNNRVVKLVEGWPIDYSENDISFLTLDGNEVLISRENIWKISIIKIKNSTHPEETSGTTISFNNRNTAKYSFVHPYPFRLCPDFKTKNRRERSKTVTVYPQQMLNDLVQIKIELDRLQEGRERIKKYGVYQQFYAVPQIYKNLTSLGYWFSYGSRYGASESRSNNLTPILQNEFSSGVFGYQHLLLTGSAPMPYSIHEETQTQFYYRFKADYFHMGFMLDPNMFLVPWDKYMWKSGDLEKLDDGINPTFAMELGLDYGYFTFQFYLDALNMGIRNGDLGYYGGSGSIRAGTSFQNHFLKVELQYDPWTFIRNKYSQESDESNNGTPDILISEVQVGVFRFNLETTYFKNIHIRYSFIYRRIKFRNRYNDYKVGDDFTDTEGIKEQLFNYRSRSFTSAVYFIHSFKNSYTFGVFSSLEYHTAASETYEKEYDNQNFYPKLGVYASLFF